MQEEIRDIRIEDYNYPLPDERIAKHPLAEREMCKLLTYSGGEIGEYLFRDIPSLLPDNSMLVYNNTRVINARLRFQKPNLGAIIEVFCLEPIMPRDYALVFQCTDCCRWLCFVGNAKRWKEDSIMRIVNVNGEDVELCATKVGRRGNAFEIDFSWNKPDVTFASILEAIGEIPIPPYLNRNTEPSDSKDYQTVYSHVEGSVAAPTAGLHFTDEILEEVDRRGITRRELTLHVGAGTFQPVKSDTIGEHAMHTEFISVTRELLVDLINAPAKIIAVGTTSVRTLESLYYIGVILHSNPNAGEEELNVPQWLPYQGKDTITTKEALQEIINYIDRNNLDCYMGSTRIMIAPSYKFHVVDGIITNFHQPQSTLLLLVSAFVDGDWKSIYDYALSHDFRFLSYGDSSLLLR
ncbi:MAG: S-adenosylmethionine:tRNA ribosyltransferase-isomerase [Muribaculaceae bacterium]|nr:S-adenosylmethionine:tRNA ribosyltransferase-isomerase [Muribaculaceae bacterium]